MKAWKLLAVFSLVLLWSGAALAQDPAKVAPANYKLVFENASVRVLRIAYAPGAKSVMHSHPESIVIPLTTGATRFTGADGKSESPEMVSESAVYIPGVTHTVENVCKGPVDGIFVEFKSRRPVRPRFPIRGPTWQ